MNKEYAVLLLLIILFPMAFSMIHLASASSTIILAVEPHQYQAPVHYVNETFNVNVTISNVKAATKLIGVHFRLSYDPTLLEVLSVQEGPFFTQFNQTSTPPYTFFASYVEDDGLYGPHILVGTMLMPNATGDWPGPFPEGNGTIATITFKEIYQPVYPQPAASCNFTFLEVKLLDADGNEIVNYVTEDGYYEVVSLHAPTLTLRPAAYNASRRGEIFYMNVDLNVDVRWQLIGVHFRLSYDPTLLEVLSVQEGPFFTQFNQTSTPPYTFFASYVEDDGLYGPHILVGTMLMPNATGDWPGPFPEGNGTIATITFNATGQPTVEPEPPANCTLSFVEVKLINVLGEELPFNATTSSYQIPPMLYPVASFNYEPASPSVGEIVIFNASESYDPDYSITLYTWDFGDGTVINTTDPIAYHVYSQQGTFNVTLIVTDIDGLSANTTKTISVTWYEPLTVNIDVGSIHFAGEIAEFYILVSDFGRPIDVSKLKASLYYNGAFLADLSNLTERVDKGLYRIVYEIPSTAQYGTYTLLIQVELDSIRGANIKSFLVSSTLTEWNAQFLTVNGTVAMIKTDVGIIRTTVEAINLTVVNVNDNVMILNSTLGIINATIYGVDTKLSEINGTMLVTIRTSVGNIEGYVKDVDDGGLATIDTALGEVKVNLSTLLDRVPEEPPRIDTFLWISVIFSILAFAMTVVIVILLRKK